MTNSINATLRSAHDGKVWYFTIEYAKGLLYFDWLYFSMAWCKGRFTRYNYNKLTTGLRRDELFLVNRTNNSLTIVV